MKRAYVEAYIVQTRIYQLPTVHVCYIMRVQVRIGRGFLHDSALYIVRLVGLQTMYIVNKIRQGRSVWSKNTGLTHSSHVIIMCYTFYLYFSCHKRAPLQVVFVGTNYCHHCMYVSGKSRISKRIGFACGACVFLCIDGPCHGF